MSEPHDVRGHFPYHHYDHPTDHSHESHGPCDYNGGPGSDQCPHGVFYAAPLDPQRLGYAMDLVSEEDAHIGVVGRGSYADRVVAEYNNCPWHGSGTLPGCTCPTAKP